MNTVLRIQLWNGSSWATTHDFVEDEVTTILRYTDNGVQVLHASKAKPILQDMSKVSAGCGGRERWVFEIHFYHQRAVTKPKVEGVKDNNYKVRVYYKYVEDQSTYVDCVVDPNWVELFYRGHEAAAYETIMRFYGQAE